MEQGSVADKPLAYQFNDWQLCLATRELKLSEQSKTLEPLIFDLLLYFVENNERIITRQNLVEGVWKQGFVDDNAINRAISELRKTLATAKGDAPLIKTHYKQGYSFVPDVVPVMPAIVAPTTPTAASANFAPQANTNTSQTSLGADEAAINPQAQGFVNNAAAQEKTAKPLLILSIIFLIGVVAIIAWLFMPKVSAPSNDDTDAVNSQASDLNVAVVSSRTDLLFKKGLSLFPLASPDGKLFTYGHVRRLQNGLDLFVRNLDTHQEVLVANYEDDLFPVAIDNKGNFVYQLIGSRQDKYLCEVFLALNDNGYSPAPHKKLFDCDGNVKISGALINNGTRLIYSKPNYRGNIMRSALVSRDLVTSDEYQITSPNVTGMGDKHVSVSPSQKSLVFFRNGSFGGSILVSDIDGSQQRVLKELDYTVSSIKWNNDGSTITWLNHRDWELNTLNIENNQLSVKALDYDEPINPFTGISILGEKRLVFASDYVDYDIHSFDLNNVAAGHRPLIDSFSKEYRYLPLNGDIDGVFLKSDSPFELWSQTGELKQKISNVADLENITGFSASQSKTQFLLSDSKSIRIYDTQSLTIEHFISLDYAIKSVSWFSDEQFVVIKATDDGPRVGTISLNNTVFEMFADIPANSVKKVGNNQIGILDFDNQIHIFGKSGNKIGQVQLNKLQRANWTATEDTIYFEQNQSELWQLPIDGSSEPSFVLDTGPKGILQLHSHADTNMLFITTVYMGGNTFYDLNIE